MKKITLLIAIMLSLVTMGYGQTVLINPAAEGGFANGATFAANGWTAANSANNPWVIGTAASTGALTGNAAYISNAGTTYNYDLTLSSANYFWRDVTVPAGQTKVTLNFNWIGQGEALWDMWQVFVAPTTVTPTASTTHPGNGNTNIPTALAGATNVGYGYLSAGVQYANLPLPASVAGTTFRLIFLWKSDTSGGVQTPTAIDNISLTSEVPGGDFVSIASGNWNSPSTWNLNKVPNYLDTSVTIAPGHTVTIDGNPQTSPNTTVNGTIAYSDSSSSLSIVGNLTVGASGIVNVYSGTVGRDLIVSGNLTNNGAINVSVGAAATGGLTLNGSAVQTISGTGTFVNNMIRNLTFSNTSTAIPNINWSFNNISVEYNLTITNAKINLGTNKLTYGTSDTLTGNSFTFTNGGFMAGGKFARWWASSGGGYTSTGVSSLPTAAGGRYPFYTAGGQQRLFYLGRTTASAGGVFAVTYNDVNTVTAGLSILDGTYTVNERFNNNFVVTTEGTSPAAASYFVTLFQPGAYVATNGNGRVITQGAAISGTHSAGSGTLPYVQRSAVSLADLTIATGLYAGLNTADIPYVAVANGNWDAPATWNKNAVPTCTDLVTINTGFNVTVNSAANVARNLTIATGGTLTIASGDLTVGCTLKNNIFTNSGTLTVSGGTFNVNGNMLHTSGSTFNQSGGDINVDGNDAGAAATSVASSTAIVQISTNLINWTGGTLTLVDPHANSTSTYTLQYSGANVDVTAGHTLRFGNGTSTDAGGSGTYGFRYYVFQGSGRLTFNNIIVNGGTGTNRFVTNGGSHGINGDLTINANSEFRDSGNILYFAKNIVNNGTYIGSGTMYLGTVLAGTTGVSTNAQTISGAGTFVNNATPASVTAKLVSVTVNNTNATGVTLGVPLSLSGTLTLTAGKVNTTAANLLTVGTATLAGTVSGGSATAYVNGPLARTIGNANTLTNYLAFPVGKSTYAPVFLAPATTAVSVMKAEAFDGNTGTSDPSIINLSATRRWEAPLVSGTITSLNVRLGEATIVATSIPVMASAADGAYASGFGSVATYLAGTPNTTQSNTAVTAANYTGFLSFADSNSCSGTPAPGNTIASATDICQGTVVNFSVQSATIGSGVTYQWQTSPDNTTYTDISGATTATYSIAPTASVYYRLKVTCSSGPAIGYSTPVQITFPNSVTATTPGSRCGIGSVALSATPSVGASIKWYETATSSNIIGAGNSFTTPVVTATTSFYAVAESAVAGTAPVGTATTTTSDNIFSPFTSNYEGARIQYLVRASELITSGVRAGNLNSIAFNVTAAGGYAQTGYTVKIAQTSTTAFTGAYIAEPFTTVYGPTLLAIPTVGINTLTFSAPFAWDGTSNIVIEICHDNDSAPGTCTGCFGANSTVRYTTTSFNSVYGKYADNNSLCGTENGTAVTSFTTRPNITFGGQVACFSARTPVVATINAPPALTLSGNPAAICAGQTTAAVTITAGAADYDTYVWTPTAGVSGTAATGWTFNPAVSTAYTLMASQSGGLMCGAIPVTVNVTVNALPSASIALPATASVCQESTQSLTITNAIGTLGATLGTGTTAPGNTSYPNPLSAYYGGTKTQILFTSDELIAQGLNPGTVITTLSFDLNSSSAAALNDFRIKIGTTANTNTTAGFVPSGPLTTVYNATYTPVAGTTGLVPFTLTTPYTWAGGNLIVEIAHNAGNTGNGTGTTTRTTTTTFNSVYTGAKDSTTPAGLVSYDALTSYDVSSASTLRPNVVFGYTSTNTVVWSPVTNLYTDAAATIAYSGQNIATVYTKPTANITYTATVSNTAGCQRVRTVAVTLVNTPAPTVPAPTQDICNAGTIATLAATGTGIKWYAAANGGTALASTVALVNGTTYYASQTANGCESLTRTALSVNINVIAAPTVPAATQEFCNAGTVANLVATGTGIKWYAAATGGTALTATAALVNNTQYFASQTVGGCESVARTGRTAIINVVAAPVVVNAAPVLCNSGTVADLAASVTGTDVKWYAAANGGTALLSTDVIVSGTPYYASQTITTCEGIVRATVTPTINVVAAPTVVIASPVFCNTATVADLAASVTGTDVKWYDAANGGTALLATDVLVSGTPYYASQTISTCEGLLRATVTPTVNVTDAPAVANATPVFCNTATVADLAASVTGTNVKWYADATGGTELLDSDALVSGTTYYASQTIDDCEGLVRAAVTPTVNVTAVPTGDNEQEFCDAATVADLSAEGDTITWYDAETGGAVLAADTALADGTVYYASQSVDDCEGLTRFAVTAIIHTVVADAPANESVCNEYVLPALTSGAYFTETGGQGTEIAAGTAITETTTLYVYAQEGTDVVCSDENVFTITVANIAAPTGSATQTINVTAGENATVADLVTDPAAGTITWYASEEDAQAGENALSNDEVLENGATYYATQTIDGCTSADTFAVLVDVVLGRNDFDVKAFTYHPNPVKDIINLSYSSEITSVTVFNLLGQQVIAQKANATEVKVDMSSLADGAYIVNVTAGNTVKTIKVIKKQ